MEGESKAKIPDMIDIELACDADENTVWEEESSNPPPPRARITIGQAVLGGTTREEDPLEDRLQRSDN